MKTRETLLAVALMASTAAGAANYGYLTFRQSDGTLQSLTALGLQMKFQDGNLVATQGTETLTLDAASLAAMFFSESATTGISSLQGTRSSVEATTGGIAVTAAAGSRVLVSSVGGVLMANLTASSSGTTEVQLPKGVYVVNVNGTTTKIIVK